MWENKTVVVMGSGPSLTVDQVESVKRSGHPLVVVNDGYKLAPWAFMLYACDRQWWRWHEDTALKFKGLKVTVSDVAAELYRTKGLMWLPGEWENGFSQDPTRVYYGKSSGYQAANIAYLAGARRILLLGFDLRSIEGKNHWFGEHPNKVVSHYPGFVRIWETVPKTIHGDCEIINVTPGSALKIFPMMDLDEALAL